MENKKIDIRWRMKSALNKLDPPVFQLSKTISPCIIGFVLATNSITIIIETKVNARGNI